VAERKRIAPVSRLPSPNGEARLEPMTCRGPARRPWPLATCHLICL
jgi:hypothetical protein